MRRPALAALLALLTTVGPMPALAAPDPLSANDNGKRPPEPWVAVGLSAIPLVLAVPTMIAGFNGTHPLATGSPCDPQPGGPSCTVDITYPAFSMPIQTAVGISAVLPLGLAGGYAYAGDPVRGALVGAGGVAVPLLAGLLGFGLDNGLGMSARLGYEKPTGIAPLMMSTAILAGLTYVAYHLWALTDVYRTAQSANLP